MEDIGFFKRCGESVWCGIVWMVNVCDNVVVYNSWIVVDGSVNCYYCWKFNGFVCVYCVNF